MSPRKTSQNSVLGKIGKLAANCRIPEVRLTVTLDRVRLAFVCEEVKPGGSHKHHLVTQHLHDAVETGQLQAHGTVVIPSSGSTGITTAKLCKRLGFGCVVVVPAGTSTAKLKLLSGSGAATETAADLAASRDRASDIARAGGHFLLDQFAPAPTGAPGPSMARLHLTAVEKAFGRMPDETIVTFGTGTTALSFRREVTNRGLATRITDAGVDGGVSALFYRDGDRSVKRHVAHKIEGVNTGFIPASACRTAVDGSVPVVPAAAFAACLEMKALGLDCGPSSGLAVYGALTRAANRQPGTLISVPVYDASSRYPETLLNPAYLETLEPALTTYRRQIRIFLRSGIWMPLSYCGPHDMPHVPHDDVPPTAPTAPTAPATSTIPTMWPADGLHDGRAKPRA